MRSDENNDVDDDDDEMYQTMEYDAGGMLSSLLPLLLSSRTHFIFWACPFKKNVKRTVGVGSMCFLWPWAQELSALSAKNNHTTLVGDGVDQDGLKRVGSGLQNRHRLARRRRYHSCQCRILKAFWEMPSEDLMLPLLTCHVRPMPGRRPLSLTRPFGPGQIIRSVTKLCLWTGLYCLEKRTRGQTAQPHFSVTSPQGVVVDHTESLYRVPTFSPKRGSHFLVFSKKTRDIQFN